MALGGASAFVVFVVLELHRGNESGLRRETSGCTNDEANVSKATKAD